MFKYKQKLLTKTEYVEALALYYYCNINNIDFKNTINNRKVEDLNNFPDFIVDDKYLEIARASSKKSGKQQTDITDVFDRKDEIEDIVDLNKEFSHYKGDEAHDITFGKNEDVMYGITDVDKPKLVIEDIKKVIISKYNKYKNKEITKDIDLFVIFYRCLDNDSLKELFDWYSKAKDINNYFKNIYVSFLYLEDDTLTYILKMNKPNSSLIGQHIHIDKNELADTIFNLGWLNRKDYIKN